MKAWLSDPRTRRMVRGGCGLQGLTSAVVRTGFLEEVRARVPAGP